MINRLKHALKRLAPARAQPPQHPPAAPSPQTAQERELQATLDRYTWYHTIALSERVRTRASEGGYPELWRFIGECLAEVDLAGKHVLDIGCRDGLFSFEAERRGAAEVVAIDNDLSPGAVEVLKPHFNSRVQFEQCSVYDLPMAFRDRFDVVLFFGVLYHLRYPFWGLRKVIDATKQGGTILVETGILVDTKQTRDLDLLFCPVDNSPYEKTSCTFFNRAGLVTTMASLGCRATGFHRSGLCSPSPAGGATVERCFLAFGKHAIPRDEIGTNIYWDGCHRYHSAEARELEK